MNDYRLVIIIPAFNEEATIGMLVSSLKKIGQVLVVDDCSSDNTAIISRSRGASVISHEFNQGYSSALNTGFNEAFLNLKANGVITIDGDGEHSVESILDIANLLKENKVPLILGIRDKKNRVIENIIGLYIKLRFGISDIFCGVKGYQANIFHAKGCFDSNFTIGTELTIGCIKGGINFQKLELIPILVWENQDLGVD